MDQRQWEQFLLAVEKCVSLANSLAREIGETCRAFAQLDLDAIREHTSAQLKICEELRATQEPLTNLADPTMDDVRRSRVEAALQTFDSACREVLRLNKLQQEVIRRSRQTLRVMMNLLVGHLEVYEAPMLAPIPATHRLRRG